METTADRNTATLIHLSSFTQYFIPFGNFIFPAVIWSLRKDKSDFINYNGKQVINFQLSLLLYTVALFIIAIPFIVYAVVNGININYNDNMYWTTENFPNEKIAGIATLAIIGVIIFCTLKVFEFFLVLYASIKNSRGENFRYPLSIKFIK
jgi:uncharacterized Tic20 family protein